MCVTACVFIAHFNTLLFVCKVLNKHVKLGKNQVFAIVKWLFSDIKLLIWQLENEYKVFIIELL